MPEAVFETDKKSKHDHIEAIVSIRPDERHLVPDAETRQMVSGVRAKNPSAIHNLISTKLVNIYDYVSSSEETISRQDLTLYDVMAMGCLAITEAGHSVKPETSQITPMLITQSKRALGKLLTNSKLIPSLHKKGRTVAIGTANGHEDRIMEFVMPAGRAEEAIALGLKAERTGEESIELDRNVIIHQATERIQACLTDRDRKVLLGRYCMGLTIEELGSEFGITHQYISKITGDASKKARNAVGYSAELFYNEWMPGLYYLVGSEA